MQNNSPRVSVYAGFVRIILRQSCLNAMLPDSPAIFALPAWAHGWRPKSNKYEYIDPSSQEFSQIRRLHNFGAPSSTLPSAFLFPVTGEVRSFARSCTSASKVAVSACGSYILHRM